MNQIKDIIESLLRKHASYFLRFAPSLQKTLEESKYAIGWFRDNQLQEKFTKNIYVCPFCKINFIALQNNEIITISKFDLDHYPPKSVGGKRRILVCKPCNNYYGETLDHYLENHLKFQSFLKKGPGKINSTLRYSNTIGNYKGNIQWNKNELIFELPLNKYPLINKWMLKNHSEESKINFTLSFPKDDVLARSILRIAFMFCFDFIGYSFILSPIGLNMHNCIDGKANCINNFGILKTDSPLPYGLNLIREPEDISCMIISFSITATVIDSNENLQVVIPKSSNQKDIVSANNFIEKVKTNKTMNLKYQSLNPLF